MQLGPAVLILNILKSPVWRVTAVLESPVVCPFRESDILVDDFSKVASPF